MFDDLKHNATLAAMLVYLASEDPDFIKRDRSPGTWPPGKWPRLRRLRVRRVPSGASRRSGPIGAGGAHDVTATEVARRPDRYSRLGSYGSSAAGCRRSAC